MTHALPDYLTRGVGFDDCPPGHRFGLYFNGWEADWRKPSNKTPAFKTVAGALPQHSRDASPRSASDRPCWRRNSATPYSPIPHGSPHRSPPAWATNTRSRTASPLSTRTASPTWPAAV